MTQPTGMLEDAAAVLRFLAPGQSGLTLANQVGGCAERFKLVPPDGRGGA